MSRFNIFPAAYSDASSILINGAGFWGENSYLDTFVMRPCRIVCGLLWNLTERIADVHKPETIQLPTDAARYRAREIINQLPQSGFLSIVENGQQLPDGQIEFTTRRSSTGDRQ